MGLLLTVLYHLAYLVFWSSIVLASLKSLIFILILLLYFWPRSISSVFTFIIILKSLALLSFLPSIIDATTLNIYACTIFMRFCVNDFLVYYTVIWFIS